MKESDLAAIHNFSIKNEWGLIVFYGMTDVRHLDLDKLVIIEKGQIELYPEGTTKPAKGKGLNKTACVTFFQYGLKTKPDLNSFIAKFKDRASKMGAIYIGHEVENDMITIQIEGVDS